MYLPIYNSDLHATKSLLPYYSRMVINITHSLPWALFIRAVHLLTILGFQNELMIFSGITILLW